MWDKIADDDKLKGAEIFVTFWTIASGVVWAYLAGLTAANIAQVMATLGTGLIVIVTVLRKLRAQQFDNFVTAGSTALQKLQSENANILNGPRYARGNRQNMDPDPDKVDDRKYLFFQKDGDGKEANFIPVIPFKRAEVLVYIGYEALRIAAKIDKPDKDTIDKMKEKTKQKIMGLAESKYKGLYEEIPFDPTKKQTENLCVALDFIDDKITFKQFEKIVYAIGKVTVEVLRSPIEKV